MVQARTKLEINWTGVKLYLNAHRKQIRRQMVKRKGEKRRVDWIYICGFTFCELGTHLRGIFYFQHNRKLPDSAGTLDKGKKEQMLWKGFVVGIFGRNLEIKVSRSTGGRKLFQIWWKHKRGEARGKRKFW